MTNDNCNSHDEKLKIRALRLEIEFNKIFSNILHLEVNYTFSHF